jgi:hypothetical protein
VVKEDVPIDKRSSRRKWQLHQEVLKRSLEGDTCVEIAERLHRSLKTVYRVRNETCFMLKCFDALIFELKDRLKGRYPARDVLNYIIHGHDHAWIIQDLKLSPVMIGEAYALIRETFLAIVKEFIPMKKSIEHELFRRDAK